MGSKINEVDVIAMALLYRNQCDGSMMISYEKLKEYGEVVNENLEGMNSNCSNSTFENDNKLYFLTTDEEGRLYAVIDPSRDLREARRWHIGCMPLDYVVASQLPNALDVIGLELINGVFIKKENKSKVKTYKR